MTGSRGPLTPFLASALKLGGPSCERAFMVREERTLLRAAAPEDVRAIRNIQTADGEDPDPRPVIFCVMRKAA